MYEIDPTERECRKWRKITDILQGASIGGIFVMIIVCERLPRAQAKVAVWYMAVALALIATAAFFAGRKHWKCQKAQFDAQTKRIEKMYKDAGLK